MERKGNYIQTYTGVRFYPFDPKAEEINIIDIAAALSKICRFTGHTSRFYSVAQHSVLCSNIAPPELALHALMHDATEAYLGDVAQPIKQMKEMRFYKKAEAVLEFMIFGKYNIEYGNFRQVKEIDNRILFTEKRDLLEVDLDWGYSIEAYEEKIKPIPPEQALREFLNRFKQLSNLSLQE